MQFLRIDIVLQICHHIKSTDLVAIVPQLHTGKVEHDIRARVMGSFYCTNVRRLANSWEIFRGIRCVGKHARGSGFTCHNSGIFLHTVDQWSKLHHEGSHPASPCWRSQWVRCLCLQQQGRGSDGSHWSLHGPHLSSHGGIYSRHGLRLQRDNFFGSAMARNVHCCSRRLSSACIVQTDSQATEYRSHAMLGSAAYCEVSSRGRQFCFFQDRSGTIVSEGAKLIL